MLNKSSMVTVYLSETHYNSHRTKQFPTTIFDAQFRHEGTYEGHTNSYFDTTFSAVSVCYYSSRDVRDKVTQKEGLLYYTLLLC